MSSISWDAASTWTLNFASTPAKVIWERNGGSFSLCLAALCLRPEQVNHRRRAQVGRSHSCRLSSGGAVDRRLGGSDWICGLILRRCNGLALPRNEQPRWTKTFYVQPRRTFLQEGDQTYQFFHSCLHNSRDENVFQSRLRVGFLFDANLNIVSAFNISFDRRRFYRCSRVMGSGSVPKTDISRRSLSEINDHDVATPTTHIKPRPLQTTFFIAILHGWRALIDRDNFRMCKNPESPGSRTRHLVTNVLLKRKTYR